MNKILFSALILLLSQNLLAGDAGYSSSTCVSPSMRTVLTELNDYSEGGTVFTLIIDGVPAIYKLSDPSIMEEGDDGYVTYYKNGQKAFSIQGPEKTITVYKDPLEGTIAMNNATQLPITISVKCTDYWPEP